MNQSMGQTEKCGACRTRLALLLIALVVSAVMFGTRGVQRGLSGGGDLRMLYAIGTVWAEGGNPYDFESIVTVFREDGGDPDRQLTDRKFISLYPPSTLPAIGPFGLLSFQQARVVLTIVSVFGVALLAWLAIRLCGVEREPRAWAWVIVGVLLLTPIHSTLAMGQITILVVIGLLLGLLWAREGREVLAGIALGVATAVKPQLVGLLVLWLAWRGCWRGFASACVTGIVLSGIGILRMELAGVVWWPQMIENLHVFSDGGNGDPRQSNPAGWWRMMNLPMLLHVFTDNRSFVSLINWTVFAVLISTTLIWGRHDCKLRPRDSKAKQTETDFLLVPAILAVACLLPMYHRHYDAVSLLIPLCWLIGRWRSQQFDWRAWLVALTLLVFYIPNTTVLIYYMVNPRLPEGWDQSVAWRASAMGLQVWALLFMSAGLVLALRHRSTPARSAAPRSTEGAA